MLKSQPVPSEVEWLARRLQEVGLERSDDLSLLEGKDVAPNISALSGIPDWELQTLSEDFPRTLKYKDGIYRCEVRPQTNTVYLTPMDGVARRVGPPARQHLPRFRGFKVVYSNASLEVVIRG